MELPVFIPDSFPCSEDCSFQVLSSNDAKTSRKPIGKVKFHYRKIDLAYLGYTAWYWNIEIKYPTCHISKKFLEPNLFYFQTRVCQFLPASFWELFLDSRVPEFRFWGYTPFKALFEAYHTLHILTHHPQTSNKYVSLLCHGWDLILPCPWARLTCYYFVDARRKQESSGPKTKVFITHRTIKSMIISIFALVSIVLKIPRSNMMGPSE